MRLNNNERIGRALNLLAKSLGPFVEREMAKVYGNRALEEKEKVLRRNPAVPKDGKLYQDVQSLLTLINDRWEPVFSRVVASDQRRTVRNIIGELKDIRNRWAHPEEPFNDDDTYRALDSIARFLSVTAAEEAAGSVNQLKQELLDNRWNELKDQEQSKVISASSASRPQTRSHFQADGEYITNTEGLNYWQVVGKRVLCPACGRKVFDQWPYGWDSHSAHRCSGVTGSNDEERKSNYKRKFRHLFKQ